MVLSWLKKILGRKEENLNAPVHSPMGSTHTMGPEELLSPADDAELLSEENVEASLERFEEEEKREPSDEEAMRIMEAAMFMAGKGMSVEDLGKIANISFTKARGMVSELIDDFNARPSALEIVEDTGGFRMKVRSPFDEKVSGLASTGELNSAELKTLAFIAYKQPLLQSQLVQVRSNTAYDHLQSLVEKGFIAREPKGRTYLLRTTKKFAEYFGTHALKVKPMPKKEAIDHTQAEDLA